MANGTTKKSFFGTFKKFNPVNLIVGRNDDSLAKYFSSEDESGEINDIDYIKINKFIIEGKKKNALNYIEEELLRMSVSDSVDYRRVDTLYKVGTEFLEADKDSLIFKNARNNIKDHNKKERDNKAKMSFDKHFAKLPDNVRKAYNTVKNLNTNGIDKVALDILYEDARPLFEKGITIQNFDYANAYVGTLYYGLRERNDEVKKMKAAIDEYKEKHPQKNPDNNEKKVFTGSAIPIRRPKSSESLSTSSENTTFTSLQGLDLEEDTTNEEEILELTDEKKIEEVEYILLSELETPGFVKDANKYRIPAEKGLFEELGNDMYNNNVVKYVKAISNGRPPNITDDDVNRMNAYFIALKKLQAKRIINGDIDLDSISESFPDVAECPTCSDYTYLERSHCYNCGSSFE